MNSESLTRRLPIGRMLTTRPTEPISNRIIAMRILLLIPLATLALAQTPPDQPQDKARIEGILLNKVNGQPVRKAFISLRVAVTRPQPAGAPAPKSYYSLIANAPAQFDFYQA